MRRSIAPGSLLAVALAAGAVYAETCLSPYIRGLRQPEKVLYAWTLPAGEGPDFLSVIDVNLASPTFSTWSTARGGSRQAFVDIRTLLAETN